MQLCSFFYGGEIKIGKDSYIGDGVRIWSGEKITIGNDVIIGHNTNIIDTNSHETDMQERQKSVRKQLELGYQKEKGNIETAPIIIKDNVWISYGVSILKGITIGEGAIIAANSVVTKNVEPFTLVAGNPAVFIKKISNETAAN
ncbi:MAG: acyltransferase [Saprospirales bacterium]|nr:acyltransferase [Saprospirales bacterium]